MFFQTKINMKNLSDFIIKPIISEKSFAEAKANKYTFKVQKGATKTDIKNAVEKLFGVRVLQVFTANIKGSKTRNIRSRRITINTSYKKARVLLPADQKIDIFEEKADEKKEKKK